MFWYFGNELRPRTCRLWNTQTSYDRSFTIPANRPKLVILSLFLLWILACVNTGRAEPDNRERIRMLSIVFDEGQRIEFFDRLQDFAHSHNFDFETFMMDTGYRPYSAALFRDDNISVLVEELTLDFNVSPRPTMIYFLGSDPEIPTDEETRMKVEALVSDLMEVIGDLPTIEITDISCKEKGDSKLRRCISSALN